MSILDPRLWLVAVLALGLSFGGGYFKGDMHGQRQKQLEWDAAVSRANAEARKLELARQSAAAAAARIAAANQARLLAVAASARRESDGLRDDLRTASEYAAQSRAAAERTAKLTSELLGECSKDYLGVAEAADRSDSEARELRQAWPK